MCSNEMPRCATSRWFFSVFQSKSGRMNQSTSNVCVLSTVHELRGPGSGRGSFGLDVRAVQEWEQGRRVPDRAARVLLTVIDREPEAVVRALSG